MRKHGFQRPFHPYQIFITTATALSVIFFSIFVLPLLPEPALATISSVYAIMFFVTVTVWAVLTGSNPSDPLEDPNKKHCSLCRLEVSERSRHCVRCGRCVVNLDHHCKWLNNCIGESNYRYFALLCVIFLLFSGLELISSIVVLSLSLIHI